MGFALVLLLLAVVDVTTRPAHLSAFLGLALSQLLGVGLYLRE